MPNEEIAGPQLAAWDRLWRTIAERISQARANVIACSHCATDPETGALRIGRAVTAGEASASICPNCRAQLRSDDIVAVGFNLTREAR